MSTKNKKPLRVEIPWGTFWCIVSITIQTCSSFLNAQISQDDSYRNMFYANGVINVVLILVCIYCFIESCRISINRVFNELNS